MIDQTEAIQRKRVAICDTQAISAEGVRVLLESCHDYEYHDRAESLEAGADLVRNGRPDIVIVDKAFGTHAVLDWLHNLRHYDAPPQMIVWGVSMTEAEALRVLHAGASGIVRKGADLRTILSCVNTVAGGR